MGMSPQEFWDMPPEMFWLKVEGYFQRENRAGLYFREMYALHYNINRDPKKGQPVSGHEVLGLPYEDMGSEQQARKPKRYSKKEMERINARFNAPEPIQWTDKEIEEATERINRTARLEREAEEAGKQKLIEAGFEPTYILPRNPQENGFDCGKRMVELAEARIKMLDEATVFAARGESLSPLLQVLLDYKQAGLACSGQHSHESSEQYVDRLARKLKSHLETTVNQDANANHNQDTQTLDQGEQTKVLG